MDSRATPYTHGVRTWVKVTIGSAALAALALVALAGTGAYFVLRTLETRNSTEADATRELDALRGRFAGRPPLVEIMMPAPEIFASTGQPAPTRNLS